MTQGSNYNIPDRSSDGPTTWVTEVEGNFNAIVETGAGFNVHEQSTPDLTVRVDAGILWDGTSVINQSAQNSPGISAPTTNPRIDRIVVVGTTGSVEVVTGASAATPSAPAVPDGRIPLARISLTTSTTSILNSSITQERPTFINAAAGTLTVSSSSTNVALLAQTLEATTTGTAAAGMGVRQTFAAENANNSAVMVAALEARYDDPTDTAEDGRLDVLVTDAGSETTVASFNQSGLSLENGSSALNYFEEGTFTPTLRGTSTAGTATYSRQVGFYQRIGSWVKISVTVEASSPTGTGSMAIGGLPFAANSTSNYQALISADPLSGTASNDNEIMAIDSHFGIIEAGESMVRIYGHEENDTSTDAVDLDNVHICVSGEYKI